MLLLSLSVGLFSKEWHLFNILIFWIWLTLKKALLSPQLAIYILLSNIKHIIAHDPQLSSSVSFTIFKNSLSTFLNPFKIAPLGFFGNKLSLII